jgi:glycosyltransferase involved in cell wall biosynthesis
MKIVVISDWFAEQMGYAENCLPRALAASGHEVHLVTSNAQPYFNSPGYTETYEPFIGPGLVACGVKPFGGYTLHRLPIGNWRGRLRIRGLARKLMALRPDVVQAFDPCAVTTYEAALLKPICGYKLFHQCHMHASVFPPAHRWGGLAERFNWLLYAATVGRSISFLSEKCYPISADAKDIAIQFYGMREWKVDVCPLGVDADLFTPIRDDAARESRVQLRRKLGFAPSDIVCIYTGRFAADKDPLCLARAIDQLASSGQPFRGLFVGSGTREQEAAIRACAGCVVHPFVAVGELPGFYQASDIGVWPRQESTSQLDAAACGLPIVLGDRITVLERVEGSGLVYREGDAADLARALQQLQDSETRRRLGSHGSDKVLDQYSWRAIARRRIVDYEKALRNELHPQAGLVKSL